MIEAREGEQLGVEYADRRIRPSRAILSMLGVGLATVSPPPLKPGSIQPTSSMRKIKKLGFRPNFSNALVSLALASSTCLGCTITGSMFGAISVAFKWMY